MGCGGSAQGIHPRASIVESVSYGRAMEMHLAYIARLQTLLERRRQHEPCGDGQWEKARDAAGDYTQCQLGKWLVYRLGRGRNDEHDDDEEKLEEVAQLHRQFHAAGGKALALADGDAEKAGAALGELQQGSFTRLSKQLLTLLAELKVEAEQRSLQRKPTAYY
eukprot:TRINITY_DN3596_c0_g1_i1.p3 TRINITY_DN3596_c0_g1~~TRINITY_DN3596_c0_g1_i1.p3  ORF type:complete len:164 (-),score=59.30 TRINITY_DN3596_c0_g1_i1:857-1348(-)